MTNTAFGSEFRATDSGYVLPKSISGYTGVPLEDGGRGGLKSEAAAADEEVENSLARLLLDGNERKDNDGGDDDDNAKAALLAPCCWRGYNLTANATQARCTKPGIDLIMKLSASSTYGTVVGGHEAALPFNANGWGYMIAIDCAKPSHHPSSSSSV